MKLNKNMPYGEIFGTVENGAKYVQGGYEFDVNGDPLPGQGLHTNPAEDVTEEQMIDANGEGDVEVTEPVADYSTMPASQIKKMVKDLGGEYKNRAQGIEYLESLN